MLGFVAGAAAISVAISLVRQVTSGITLLPQIALASLVIFFAAHALLFKLHVPSRYTG